MGGLIKEEFSKSQPGSVASFTVTGEYLHPQQAL
jgi:hypothetical protein